MFSDLACGCDVYLVAGYTDMRKGIDGLATIVQGKLSHDPFSRSLYLFCGRNRRKIKGLLWEGDGFLLLHKRLDNGSFGWTRYPENQGALTVKVFRIEKDGFYTKLETKAKDGITISSHHRIVEQSSKHSHLEQTYN